MVNIDSQFFSMRHLRRAVCGFTLFALAGCGGGDGNVAPLSLASTTRQVGNLQLRTTLTKTAFAPGETVPFTLYVKNVGSQTANLTYSIIAGNSYVKQGNTDIWTALLGNTGTHGSTTLQPNEETSFVESWDQSTLTGVPTPLSGTFTFRAWFDLITINERPLGGVTNVFNTYYTDPLTITIQR